MRGCKQWLISDFTSQAPCFAIQDSLPASYDWDVLNERTKNTSKNRTQFKKHGLIGVRFPTKWKDLYTIVQ